VSELPLLFVDDALLVLNKPAGLLSVPGRGAENQDALSLRVQAEFPDALVVHRLDMATSGLILMARGKAMQSVLNRLFAGRQVEKTYEAVLEGRLAEAEGCVDLPLVCDWPRRPRQKVCFLYGKQALTRWRLLAYDALRHRSRVLLMPETGRSHQLRVHMQAKGHPILGDEFYASPAGRAAAPRLLLHASRLFLPHPRTEKSLEFVSPAPF
jgi:tRNA pseudouridine32 synthase/23S rRNA pseudouridine746 synthase